MKVNIMVMELILHNHLKIIFQIEKHKKRNSRKRKKELHIIMRKKKSRMEEKRIKRCVKVRI